jgi:hypothetical protein
MAIPAINSADLTLIDNANASTAWSGWGANTAKWGVSTDIKREGTGAQGLAPFATGDSGWGVTGITAFDASARLIMVWVNIVATTFVGTRASKGIYVRISSSTTSWTTAYRDYLVGGNDVAWVGKGWHLIVIDANRTPDATLGTVTLTAITRVGVGFNVAATASKSDVILIDKMFHGNYIEVTSPTFTDGTNGINFNDGGGTNPDTIVRLDGGSWVTDGYVQNDFVRVSGVGAGIDGVFLVVTVTASTLTLLYTAFSTSSLADTAGRVSQCITLNDIYTKDGPTDGNWWGAIEKNRDGGLEINYRVVLGDVSGALHCNFISRGDVVIGADQAMNNGSDKDIALVSTVDTGVTNILIGYSSGTGDDRVGYGGSVFRQDQRSNLAKAGDEHNLTLDFSVATLVELYGVTMVDVGKNGYVTCLTMPNATGNFAANCSFSNSTEPNFGQAQVRNCTFANILSASKGALLWTSGLDIKNCFVLASYIGIRHTAGGTIDYDNIIFRANIYDVYNNSGAALTINNLPDSNASTSLGTPAVTFVTARTLLIVDAVANSRCYIQDGTPTELMNLEAISAYETFREELEGPSWDETGWTKTTGGSSTTDEAFATSGVTGAPSDWLAQCLQCLAAASENSYAQNDFASDVAIAWWSFEFIIGAEGLGDGNSKVIARYRDSADNDLIIVRIKQVAGSLYLEFDVYHDASSNLYTWSQPLSTAVPYIVELLWDQTNNLYSVRAADARDYVTPAAVSSGALTGSAAAWNFRKIRIGLESSTETATVYYDRIRLSVSSFPEDASDLVDVSTSYNYSGDTDVLVRIRKASRPPKYVPREFAETITNNGLTVTANQRADTVAAT